jgi:pimeloyl-ACP methyl ester carboxylesterase
MSEPIRRTVEANGVDLNIYVLAERSRTSANPPVVMLHGMRDVGLSLIPIAAQLARDRTVYLMDLRGHGLSDRPGSYAIVQFVFDLHVVMNQVVGVPATLFGHSLGGQIVCRFAALYPDLTRAAIVVEGLGPPEGRHSKDPVIDLVTEAGRIQQTLAIPEQQRPLPSVEFGAKRLLANNPRLDPERALELARQGTMKTDSGDLIWAFDPRASAVFLGLGPDDSARYWPYIQAPTCIVSGAHASEYWGGALPADSEWTGEFGPGELEGRVGRFQNAEHVIMTGSGHMVHFDEPERLAEVTNEFLRRHAL